MEADEGSILPAGDLLAGLTPSQREAVTHPAPLLAVHAGAGSGKTRVLTRRIAHRASTGELDPRHTLVITFTKRAAGELRSRLRQLGLRDAVAAGTFHAVASSQLRSWWAARRVHPPRLLDAKLGLLGEVRPADCPASPGQIAGEIEWAKARLVSPAQYPAAVNAEGRRTPLEPGVLAGLFQRYEAEKQRRRLVDFDDLLRLCAHALHNDREFAAAQHWRYRHVFVDEFQDVNPLQFTLLRAWLGSHNDLCVVGDPDQAIYGWNGADADHLVDLHHHLPEVQTVVLGENHRCTPQVLRVARAVLARDDGPPPTATRSDGEAPTVHRYDDDDAEARGVARAVRDLHAPGTSWSAQAVLVRTHAQISPIAAALADAGIPHRMPGARRLTRHPEVRRTLRALGSRLRPFATVVADLEVEAARATEADPRGVDERTAVLRLLVEASEAYADVDPNPTIRGFSAWLRDPSAGDELDAGTDAVEVCTFHSAKGLEWPVVHLAGLEDGLVPIGHARTPEELAEERRLLYVAMTRASDRLLCSWAAARAFGSRVVRRRPSEYLTLVEQAIGSAQPTTALDPAELLEEPRARLRAVPAGAGHGSTHPGSTHPGSTSADPEVLAALRRWRTTTARAAGIPDTAVLPDRTLRELAHRRPGSTDELAAVPGLGPVRAARHGSALLRVLAEPRVS